MLVNISFFSSFLHFFTCLLFCILFNTTTTTMTWFSQPTFNREQSLMALQVNIPRRASSNTINRPFNKYLHPKSLNLDPFTLCHHPTTPRRVRHWRRFYCKMIIYRHRFNKVLTTKTRPRVRHPSSLFGFHLLYGYLYAGWPGRQDSCVIIRLVSFENNEHTR